jgi:signal peptidase I
MTVTRGARLVLSLAFAALALTVLGVGLAARLAPAMGHELFSIRSGSMEPALPVGSLAIVSTDAGPPAEGQPIAFRLDNGTVVTHRVVAVVRIEDETFYRTRGDANQDRDPSLVPAESVIGPVVLNLPWLGFLLAMLGMPIGAVAIISVAGTLLTAIWLLEEFEELDDRDELGERLPPVGSRLT